MTATTATLANLSPAKRRQLEKLLKIDPKLIRAEWARRNLINFIEYTYPAYVTEPFHRLVASKLDEVVSGGITRLMVFAPPQSGKSQQVSVHFPAYWLGKYPDQPVILCSYAAHLAHSKSWQARQVVESEDYKDVFKTTTDPEARARDNWRIAKHRGELLATGVGGPITGHGAQCFPAGTMIATANGLLDIRTLVGLQYQSKVWAFDHTTGKTKLCRIVTTREYVRDDIVKITTIGGRSVTATTDHRIYVEGRGYREAALLRRGDRVKSFTQEQDLCSVWGGKERTRYILPQVLPGDPLPESIAHLCLVRRKFQEATLSTREGVAEKQCGCLLREGMRREASRHQERQEVRSMWHADAKRSKKVLFEEMQGHYPPKEEKRNMRVVQSRLSNDQQSDAVLLAKLCERSAFDENERQGEFPLQDGHELCKMVCRDASFDYRTRPLSLLCMSTGETTERYTLEGTNCISDESVCSSHRLRSEKQPSKEFGHAMQELPFYSAQLGEDEVALVQPVHNSGIRVYDIQVEGCRNFFANGILVHNCGIIDDPVENWEQARSEAARDRAWNWYRTTFRTRIWKEGRIVLIQTRWHEDDLAGRLLQADPEQWTVLRLPAIAEEQEERDDNDRRLGLPTGQPDPLGREPGEALCPNRYPIDVLEQIKKDVGTQAWYAQYQGTPRAMEGNWFKRSWLKVMEDRPKRFTSLVRYWDKAATGGGKGPFSCGVLMGKLDSYYWVLDAVRGRWTAGQREEVIKRVAHQDRASWGVVANWVEQEPGSGGKESAQATVRNLAGFIIRTDRVTGKKQDRAGPFQSQAMQGNVCLLKAPWNLEYIDELTMYPNSRFADQVDASSGAFNKLAMGGTFIA